MERESFVFYRSFRDSLDKVSDEHFAQCMRVLLSLALDGEEYSGDDPVVWMFYSLVEPLVLANNKRYIDGKKGGRPKKTTGFENEKPLVIENKNHRFENEKPNVNVNDNVNVNAHSIKSESAGAELSAHVNTLFANFTSSAAFESLMVGKGLTAAEGRKLLQDFTADCLLRGDEVMTLKEYRTRFAKALIFILKNKPSTQSENVAKGW